MKNTRNQHRLPIVYLYGEPGTGKSTLAARLPKPFFIVSELSKPKINSTPQIGIKVSSINILRNKLIHIYKKIQAKQFNYTTLVLNSMQWVESLIKDQIFLETNCRIEEISYGEGYSMLHDYWFNCKNGIFTILQKINYELNIPIVLIDNSEIKTYSYRGRKEYNRVTPSIYKKTYNTIWELVDEVMLLEPDVEIIEHENLFQSTTVIKSGNSQADYISKSNANLPINIKYSEWLNIILSTYSDWNKKQKGSKE